MTTKQKTNLYQEVTDKIVAQMEQGVGRWHKSWASEMPLNLSTGNEYRGVNILLLNMEQDEKGYADAEWMSFKQAKAMGGQVKKGEKGTKIVFFKKLEREEENGKGDTEVKKILMAKYSYVFNVNQIDGLDKKRVQQIQETHRAEHHSAASLIADSGAVIKQGSPSFSPKDDVIRMPQQESFDTLNDYYATALHELSHWSGHKSRLNRDMTGRFGNESYAMEELIAELSSAFLSAKCGIDGKLQHAEYLASWVKVLKSDNRAIFAAASKAREASEFIQELTRIKESESEAELSI